MTTKPKYVEIGGQDYLVDEDVSVIHENLVDAWEVVDGPVIQVNMEKAREIWRDNIRYWRSYEWPEVDSLFMKALETGADTTEIVAKKQWLRDLTKDPRIDQAKTPEELVQIRPTQRMKDVYKEEFGEE